MRARIAGAVAVIAATGAVGWALARVTYRRAKTTDARDLKGRSPLDPTVRREMAAGVAEDMRGIFDPPQ